MEADFLSTGQHNHYSYGIENSGRAWCRVNALYDNVSELHMLRYMYAEPEWVDKLVEKIVSTHQEDVLVSFIPNVDIKEWAEWRRALKAVGFTEEEIGVNKKTDRTIMLLYKFGEKYNHRGDRFVREVDLLPRELQAARDYCSSLGCCMFTSPWSDYYSPYKMKFSEDSQERGTALTLNMDDKLYFVMDVNEGYNR